MTPADAFAKYWNEKPGVGSPFIVLTPRFVISGEHELVHVCDEYDGAYNNYVRNGLVRRYNEQPPNGHYLGKGNYQCANCGAETPKHLKAVQTLHHLGI